MRGSRVRVVETLGALSLCAATLSLPAATFSATPAAASPHATSTLPTVTLVAPDQGPFAGGNSVTVVGTNLTGATAVDFGTTPGTTVVINSAGTQLTVNAPAGIGTVDVTVVTSSGTSAVSTADEYFYKAAAQAIFASAGIPSITVQPDTALPPTSSTSATITFNSWPTNAGAYDAPVELECNSDPSQPTYSIAGNNVPVGCSPFLIPGGPFPTPPAPFTQPFTIATGTMCPVTNATCSGTMDSAMHPVSTDSALYPCPPTATEQTNGDVCAMITIALAGLSPTKLAVQPLSFSTESQPTLAVSPTAALAGSTVSVTGAVWPVPPTGGSLAITPSVCGVGGSPTNCTVASISTPFVVTTGNLTGGITVPSTVTSACATCFLSLSGTETIVQSGLSAAVTVTDSVPLGILSDAPTISSVTPSGGPLSGGTTVTVTGTNLNNVVSVTFGPFIAGTGLVIVSPTQLTVVSPAESAGTVDIIASTLGAGSSATSSADQFTYSNLPVFGNMNPSSGPSSGGTLVSITGSNLSAVTTVFFGPSPGTNLIVMSSNALSVVSPPGSTQSFVDVELVSPTGTSAVVPGDRFTYVAVPVVSSVAPNAGPSSGGTTVVITGTGFAGVNAVKFGGINATFSANSLTQITAISPENSSGTVDITVTNGSGTSATSPSDQFTFSGALPGPTVTSVLPSSGPTTGGTLVTVTGSNFILGMTVTFGGAPATSIVLITNNVLTATTPPGGSGVAMVVVSSSGGTSPLSAGGAFTYVAPSGPPVPPGGGGYWFAGADGGVFAFGSAGFYGSMGGSALNAPVAGMAATCDGKGYWLAGADGGIFAFGDAGFFGSMGGVGLRAPIVAMAATGDCKGYWLAGADGGVFTFGDAQYYGSAAGTGLTLPVTAIAPTSDGRGYWLVTAAGVVFNYGDAGQFGNAKAWGTTAVGITPSSLSGGYWIALANGGVQAFGNAVPIGAANITTLSAPLVGIAGTVDGKGYWVFGRDGGVFTFGDAGYFGSTGATVLQKPVIAAAL